MKNIPTATRLRVSAMSVHPTPLNKIWIIAIHLVSRTQLARTDRLASVRSKAEVLTLRVVPSPAHHFNSPPLAGQVVCFGDEGASARRDALPRVPAARVARPHVFRSCCPPCLRKEPRPASRALVPSRPLCCYGRAGRG